jgi:hypothetical protein
MKRCSKCNNEYDFSNFYKDKSSKDGYRCNCKNCSKLYRDNNKDYEKEYREKNREKLSNYAKSLPKKEKKVRNSKYYLENKENIKLSSSKYYENNKENKLKYQKEYQQNNKDKRNKYLSERRKTDDLFRLITNIRNLINNSFYEMNYSKTSKTQEILGCSFEELKSYLEFKFEPWMTWKNRGIYNGELNNGWDIDHIIPLSEAISVDDIVKLNHYTNLQPLCSKINRDIKKNNIEYGFI